MVSGCQFSRAREGAIAQLGERLNGIQEVRGSNPLSSTIVFSVNVQDCPKNPLSSGFFFCLHSMKVHPDMLQSKHKRPTIWPTGHRGPYFVGHFVRLEAIWFYTVGKLIRSPCGAGCGPREGVKAVLTDVAIRNKQMTGKRSAPSWSLRFFTRGLIRGFINEQRELCPSAQKAGRTTSLTWFPPELSCG